ncbi:MAG: acyl-CoA thioesterase [Pseudomonadota bacterium]
MYPLIRTARALWSVRALPPLEPDGADHFALRIWPIDIDPFLELNNGRILTLFDMGRFRVGHRTGLTPSVRRNGWGLTVAGSSVRYRRRIRLFDLVEMRTRVVGWDARFIYMEQGLWRGETCCSHALLRMAITNSDGIVPTADVLVAMDRAGLAAPQVPDWVAAWIAADATRPWPPVI